MRNVRGSRRRRAAARTAPNLELALFLIFVCFGKGQTRLKEIRKASQQNIGVSPFQSVGCDLKLDSEKRLDRCGVCSDAGAAGDEDPVCPSSAVFSWAEKALSR